MTPLICFRLERLEFSVREIGKNVPDPLKVTYYVDEAEQWVNKMGGAKTHEIVRVVITPYK